MHPGVTRAGTLNAANHISRLGIGAFSTQSTWVQDNHFSAANITFANDEGISGNGYDGQALAIRVDGDQCVFYNCRFLAWQDTLYVHKPHAKIYFRKCLIQGAVAFVFCEARAVFDHCVIRSVGLACITAPNAPKHQSDGLVFLHCNIAASKNVSAGSVYLGGPWRASGSTTYIDCHMSSDIAPVG